MYKKDNKKTHILFSNLKYIYILIKSFKTIITVLIHSKCQDQLEIIILVL